uniref:Non-specific serine/threonine protein kinase n=1 Tax=Panagrolaimus sp. JU765 TaxID=591449 RepID=A0AC34QSB3_9BILA
MGNTEENVQNLESTPKAVIKAKDDFLFLAELGEGSYSTVYLGCERKTSEKFAIKVCLKKQIIRENKTAQVFREKECLMLLSKPENCHPFIVRLYCTFQDADSLYFVLSLASNKDLFAILKKNKKLSVDETKFVSSEIISALGHIHKFGVIHRDVKPENILLSSEGHMVLSDFGSAKKLEPVPETEKETEDAESSSDDVPKRRARRSSFVGTAHYVTPEVLENRPVDETCDYWALGCIIFQCLTGERPFADVSEHLIFRRIVALRYKFPEDFPSVNARDLIENLLILEKEDRLGSKKQGGVKKIMDHAFFENVNWENLAQVASPFR